jgi:hypothetical protein
MIQTRLMILSCLLLASMSAAAQTSGNFDDPVDRSPLFGDGPMPAPKPEPKPAPVTPPTPAPKPVPPVQPPVTPPQPPVQPPVKNSQPEFSGSIEDHHRLFEGHPLAEKSWRFVAQGESFADLIKGTWRMNDASTTDGQDPFSQKQKYTLTFQEDRIDFVNWLMPNVQFADVRPALVFVDDYTVRVILESRRVRDNVLLSRHALDCRMISRENQSADRLICHWHMKNEGESYKERGFLYFKK